MIKVESIRLTLPSGPDDERISPFIPFAQKLEEALAGWETTDAERLEQRRQRVTAVYAQLTVGDLVRERDYWDKIRATSEATWDLLQSRVHSDRTIAGLFDDGIYAEVYTGAPDNLGSQIDNFFTHFPLLSPFQQWLDQRFKKAGSVEQQASLIYLAFPDNPIYKVQAPVYGIINRYLNHSDSVKWPLPYNTDPAYQQKLIDRAASGLSEIIYASAGLGANAWGYCQEICTEFLQMLKHPAYGLRLFHDFLQCATLGLISPAQLTYILFKLKEKQGATNISAAIEQYYKAHPHLNQGLADWMHDLNIIVTGGNRFLEWPEITKYIDPDLNKSGALLSVFSGPPITPMQRAALISAKRCITVDVADLDTLSQGIAVDSELIQGRHHTSLRNAEPEINIADIQHTHIQRHLPASLDDLAQKCPFSVIEDTRGSGLWLGHKDRLEHLQQIVKLASPGTLLIYSMGMARYINIDMYFRKQADGTLRRIGNSSSLPDQTNSHAGTIKDIREYNPQGFYQQAQQICRSKSLCLDESDQSKLLSVLYQILTGREYSFDPWQRYVYVTPSLSYLLCKKHVRQMLDLSTDKNVDRQIESSVVNRFNVLFQESELRYWQKRLDKRAVLYLLHYLAAELHLTTARQGIFNQIGVAIHLHTIFQDLKTPLLGYQSDLIVDQDLPPVYIVNPGPPYNIATKPTIGVGFVPRRACDQACIFCGSNISSMQAQNSDAPIITPRRYTANEYIHRVNQLLTEHSEVGEIAITGVIGEPLIYLNDLLDIIRSLKQITTVPLRLNTNGHASLLTRHTSQEVAQELKKAGLDTIAISLNAINREDYEMICQPKISGSYQSAIEFIHACKSAGLKVLLSFVDYSDYEPSWPTLNKEAIYQFVWDHFALNRENVVFRKYMTDNQPVK